MFDEKVKEIMKTLEIDLKDEINGYKDKEAFLKGEAYWKIYKEVGKKCSECFEKASAQPPDWYDHRLHFLNFEKNMKDFNMLSADNAMVVLPLNGKILDLCSGDGFYSWMLSTRASLVDAVEINYTQHSLSKRIWESKKINFILKDIMDFEYKKDNYDMVFIRGAFEHFSEENQNQICKNALLSLKPGGWFVGDTPQNTSARKFLDAHEHEFESIDQLKNLIDNTFENTNVYSLVSSIRTTLFWQVQKKGE
jgi:SAM-dependent methyltransferase